MRTPKQGIVLLSGLLALAGACDPQAEDGKDGKAEAGKRGDEQDAAAKAKAGEAAAGEAKGEAGEAKPEVEAPAETLDGCLAECEQAILSDDNRATCRLRCKNVHGAGETASKHPVIGGYFGCFDGCAGKSETDRATCVKQCAASVTAGSGDPATSACPRACVESLGACLSPCEDKGEDDQATCRKQCEVIATKCVGACG